MASILKAAAKIIGMAILFLLVLELAARTDDYFNWKAPFWGTYSNENLSISDQYGWHNRPNARFQKWEINSFGFRGPDISKEKPEGVIRIICVGASVTFGLFESENKEYPRQMQALLDEKYPGRFQVLNAACPGMSPPRIVFYFNTWLTQFDPDIITYYPASDFYLNEVPPSKEILTIDQPSRPPFSLRLTGKARIALKGFIPQSWQTDFKRYNMEKAIDRHPKDWLWQSPPQDRLDLYRDHIEYLVDDIRQHGGQVLLATKANSISPEMNAFDRFNMTNWRSYHIRATEQCLLEMDSAAAEIIRQVGLNIDVPVADIAPYLPKTSDYFADSGHLTDKGAAIVAEKMVAKVLEMVEVPQDK